MHARAPERNIECIELAASESSHICVVICEEAVCCESGRWARLSREGCAARHSPPQRCDGDGKLSLPRLFLRLPEGRLRGPSSCLSGLRVSAEMSSAEGDAAQRAASGTVASALLQTAEGVSGERPSRAPPAAAPTKAERTTESLPSPPGGGEGRTAAAGAAACVPGLEASALNDKLLLFGEAVASAQRGLQQRLFGEEGTSAQTERRVAETRPSQNNSAACPAESAGSGAAAAAPATTAAVSAQTPAGVGPSALPSAQIVTELLQRSRLAGLLQPPAPQQQPQQQLVASDSASQQQRQRLPSSPQTAAVTTTAVAAAAAAVTGRPAFAALPSVAAAHLAAQIAALPRAATAEDSAQTRALPSTAVAAPPPLSAAPAQQNRQPQQNPHQPPIDGRWRESTAAGAAAAEASGGGAAANGRNYSGVLRALRSFESFCADVRQRGREAFARDRAFVAAASASPSWKAPFGGLSETPRDNRAEAEPAKAEEEGGGEGAALEAVAACEEARREAEASSLKRKSEDEAKPSGAAAAKRRGGTSSGPALTVGLVAESLLPFHAFFLRDLQDLAPVRESRLSRTRTHTLSLSATFSGGRRETLALPGVLRGAGEGEEAARSERLARVFESVRCACARANNPLAAAAEEGAAAASLSTAAAASVWVSDGRRPCADTPSLRLPGRCRSAS